MKNNNNNSKVISKSRWQAYVAASAASALAVLGPQACDDVNADETDSNIAGVENCTTYAGFNLRREVVFASLNDGDPFDGAFDVFGPFEITNSSASPSFIFEHARTQSSNWPSSFGILTLSAFGNISLVGGQVDHRFYASNIAYGDRLDNKQFINTDRRIEVAWGGAKGLGPYSQFLEPGFSNIGFRFDVGQGTQYGYMRIDMQPGNLNNAILVDYVWARPGHAVFAGTRCEYDLPYDDDDVFVPEPGALGVLALGSVGLLAWRRRRTLNG